MGYSEFPSSHLTNDVVRLVDVAILPSSLNLSDVL